MSRRTADADRPRPLLLTALLTAALHALALPVGLFAAPASAQWQLPPARVSSGTVSMATVGHTFTPMNATGTGGQQFVAAKALNTTTVALVDLVNQSSVPVRLSGTASLQSFLASESVSVARCTVPWSGSTCPGTSTTLHSGSLASAKTLEYGSGLAPAGRLHLRVTIDGALVSNQLTLTAAATPVRAPGDRTGG